METSVFLKNTSKPPSPTKILLKTWLEGLNFDPYFSFSAFRKRINKMCFNSKSLMWPWQGTVCKQMLGEVVWWEPAHQNERAKKSGEKGIKSFLKEHNNLGKCSMFKFVPTEALSRKAAKLEGWCEFLPCCNNAMLHASSFGVWVHI